jgi:hypothetical protein
MMPRDVHPPRLASWLVDLFTPVGEADAIRGDLLEEFSDLVSKSGFAYARRWYWRQSVRTILHLIRSGFRVAPWSIAGVVVGGMLLVQLGHAFAGWTIRTGMELLNHHVFLYHRLSGFELF